MAEFLHKRRVVFCIVAVFAASVGIYLAFFHNSVNGDFADQVSVRFAYADSDVELTITDEDDIVALKKILRGRSFEDSPACGFSNRISVTMSNGKRGVVFCPANDSCPIVRVGDSDRYIYISEEQRGILDGILGKY